ncbi:hypothetical protein FOL47_007515 [Perkinsus chesapeaki]|uniref:Uncharacterized protein n=1 Tax=Perkinsus chesapeaki TaxID=330153 RepID=A0A7J6LJW2_PERCH|nr:hypothetical protein FOL47_007515 [Perkinsus chesapeaki]
MSGMDPSAVPGFNALSNADQRTVEAEMQRLQMRDSMNTYNNMVNRCFSTCVRSFNEKKVNGEEIDCTKRCVQKFVMYSQRVALRFAEHNAEQSKILQENESRGNTLEIYKENEKKGVEELSPSPIDRDDLDVDELADRIVLMRSPWQMPSDRMAHRNNINVVSEYLTDRYGCNFAVWNIERSQRSLVEPEKFRNQILNFTLPATEAKGQSLLLAPPSLELLSRFCSSLLFWLELDRTRFVAVIHCRDTSPTTLLFIIAALVSTGVCAEVRDAIGYLRERYALTEQSNNVTVRSTSVERDASLEGSRSTVKFTEPTSWPHSLQRYAKYLQKLITADAGAARQTPTYLLKMVIIDHFIPPASDIYVEVGEVVLDRSEQFKSEIGVLATDNTYAIVDSDEMTGSMTVDMTHGGEYTVVLRGDVGIVIKSRTRSRLSARYFFHTAFVGNDEGEILELGVDDMDVTGFDAGQIPKDFKLTLSLNRWSVEDQERFEDRKRKRAEDEALARGEHLQRIRSLSGSAVAEDDVSPSQRRKVGKLSDMSPSARKGSDWSTVTLTRETAILEKPKGKGKVFFDHHMLAPTVLAKTRTASHFPLSPCNRGCDPVAALEDRGFERIHAGISLEVSDMNLFEAYAFCERYFPLSVAATVRSDGRGISRANSLAYPLPGSITDDDSHLMEDFNRLHFLGVLSRGVGEGRQSIANGDDDNASSVNRARRASSSPVSQRSFRSSLVPGSNPEYSSSIEEGRYPATQSEDLTYFRGARSRRQSISSDVVGSYDEDDDDEYHLVDSSSTTGGWYRMRYMSHLARQGGRTFGDTAGGCGGRPLMHLLGPDVGLPVTDSRYESTAATGRAVPRSYHRPSISALPKARMPGVPSSRSRQRELQQRRTLRHYQQQRLRRSYARSVCTTNSVIMESPPAGSDASGMVMQGNLDELPEDTSGSAQLSPLSWTKCDEEVISPIPQRSSDEDGVEGLSPQMGTAVVSSVIYTQTGQGPSQVMSTIEGTPPPLPTGKGTPPPLPTGKGTPPPLPTGRGTPPPLPTGKGTPPPLPTGKGTPPPLPTGRGTPPPLPTGKGTPPPLPTGRGTAPPLPCGKPLSSIGYRVCGLESPEKPLRSKTGTLPSGKGMPPSLPTGKGMPPSLPTGKGMPPSLPTGKGMPPSLPSGKGMPPSLPSGKGMPPSLPSGKGMPPSLPSGKGMPPSFPTGKGMPLSLPSGKGMPPSLPRGKGMAPPPPLSGKMTPPRASLGEGHPPSLPSGKGIPPCAPGKGVPPSIGGKGLPALPKGGVVTPCMSPDRPTAEGSPIVLRSPPLASPPPPPLNRTSPQSAPSKKKPAGVLPLGKKLHWKAIPDRLISSTIWASYDEEGSSTPSDDHSGQTLARDVAEMKTVFGASAAQLENKHEKKKIVDDRPKLIEILDQKRAQNAGLVMARLPVELLIEKMENLDVDNMVDASDDESVSQLSHPRAAGSNSETNTEGCATVEMLEKLSSILPTTEEAEMLRSYHGDLSLLRPIERRLMPLAVMKRPQFRIKAMVVFLTFPDQLSGVRRSIGIFQEASDQVRSSQKLRRLLFLVLKFGNFVNHGTTDLMTRGYTLESLLKLMEFKSTSVPGVTMLHYVACRLMEPEGGDKGNRNSAVPMELAEELNFVVSATSENTEVIVATLTALDRDLKLFQREAEQQASQYSGEALRRLESFTMGALNQLAEVKEDWKVCEDSLKELRRYFGEDPKRCTVEDFFGTLKAFLDSYKRACNDIKRNPKKFQQLIYRKPPILGSITGDVQLPHQLVQEDDDGTVHIAAPYRSVVKTTNQNPLIESQANCVDEF